MNWFPYPYLLVDRFDLDCSDHFLDRLMIQCHRDLYTFHGAVYVCVFQDLIRVHVYHIPVPRWDAMFRCVYTINRMLVLFLIRFYDRFLNKKIQQQNSTSSDESSCYIIHHAETDLFDCIQLRNQNMNSQMCWNLQWLIFCLNQLLLLYHYHWFFQMWRRRPMG